MKLSATSLRAVTLALVLLAATGCMPVIQVSTVAPVQTIEQEMETFLQAHLSTGVFMGTVLVARGDDVLYSRGYGMANLEHDVPNTPQTVFRLGSLSKQFTAAAILQLQEQGRLDVHDTVGRYLPTYPHGGEITIHQLLNHTSGTPDYLELLSRSTGFRNAVTLDELMATFSGLPLEFPPGSRFGYSNSGYVVLTAIIETVSGRRYADYLAEHIFGPLGMDATGYEDWATILPHRAAGYTWDGAAYHNAEFIDMSNPAGAGGLVSTALDMYRWDRALYAGTILSPASHEVYFAPTSMMGEQEGYAYGWAVAEMSGRKYSMHGGGINGFNTFVIRYPPEELYVVVLGNVESAPAQAVAMGLAAIALGDSYELPGQRPAVAVDPALFEKLVGSYQLTPDVAVTVTTEAGRLFAQATGEPRFEILPESETEFVANVNGTNVPVRFQIGEDGAVSGLIILQDGQELRADKVE